MEYILNNTILALLEYPDSTLLAVNRMYTDKEYRKKVVDNIKDPSVRSFWVDEWAKYTDRYTQDATPAIQNKVGQFTANPLVRNIIGQPKSSFDLRKMMDEKKIVIINLSKGRIGEDNANLLGGMLITKIYLAAMSRADLPDEQARRLPNFYLYIDEFQSFANETFSDILSEARKYKLNLTIAHQYIEQMPEEVRSAVFGNVGTMIMFRVGAYDAEVLEKEFAPAFTAEDMVNLGFTQIYLKLMINGVTSHPFSAVTLPPIEPPAHDYHEAALTYSRDQFSRPRGAVEHEINTWYQPVEPEEKKPVSRLAPAKSDERRHMERRSSGERRWQPRRGQEARNNHRGENRFSPKMHTPAENKENKEQKYEANEISLDELKQKPRKDNSILKDKGPSKEKLSDLRSALAGVLAESESDKQNTPNASPDRSNTARGQQEPSPKSADPGNNTNNTQQKSPREVPREELESMLRNDT